MRSPNYLADYVTYELNVPAWLTYQSCIASPTILASVRPDGACEKGLDSGVETKRSSRALNTVADRASMFIEVLSCGPCLKTVRVCPQVALTVQRVT